MGAAVSRALADNRPVPRRGLSRDEAAIYIGVSPTTFDKLVADGRMPQPRRIDGRKVWDIRALDLHFDMLPIHGDASQSSSWADA
jgi:excisionase family DNA binding protein